MPPFEQRLPRFDHGIPPAAYQTPLRRFCNTSVERALRPREYGGE
jgi:hypothetical protein